VRGRERARAPQHHASGRTRRRRYCCALRAPQHRRAACPALRVPQHRHCILEQALTKLHVGKKKTKKKAKGKRRREEEDDEKREELLEKVQKLEQNVVDLTQDVERANSESDTHIKQAEDAVLDTVQDRLQQVFDRINTFTKWKPFFAQGHTFGGINGYTGDGGGSASGSSAVPKPMDSDDIREDVIAFICCQRERNS